ncbi:MAG: hypothetical protein R6W91_01560 [Thermoplasmata archaeon]
MSGFIFDGLSPEEDDQFINRECYVFNKNMERSLDDARCIHCRFYLTVNCKHIDDFVDEEGDV